MDDNKTAATSALPKSLRDTHGLLGRVVKSNAKTIVAERLLAARLMNGYSQTEAAEKLQYGTPAQLSQWEQCRRAPPMHMLMRASAVYRVSMDYLCGVSADPDRDPQSDVRRRTLRATEEITAGATSTLMQFIADQMQTGGPAIEIASAVLEEGEKFHRALARFMELNRAAFENDMPGGAPLVGMHERFEANALKPARALLDRFKFVNAPAARALEKKYKPAAIKTGDIFDQTGA